MRNKERIVIPDIHGRKFWKDALEYIKSGVPTIFLGDYLDPYSYEGITPEQAIYNFEEILEVAKDKNTKVTLLTGNHDCTYIYPEEGICECRTDYLGFPKIQKLFWDNLDLFSLATTDGNILYSHAGIHKDWLSFVGITEEDIIDQPLSKLSHKIVDSLLVVSWYRGGWGDYGSPVWADVREFSGNSLGDITQVVGHTQQKEKPVRVGNVICLDCRECFYVDPEGDVRYLKNDIAV